MWQTTNVRMFTFAQKLLNGTAWTDLKCDTANRQVAAILQHVEVLRHQRCAVDETVGRLGVVPSLRVFPCHVLKPRQTKVRRVLVAFGNPETKNNSSFTYNTSCVHLPSSLAACYLYIKSMSISGSCWCSFIFTVSVRIMCRLKTRSWTCINITLLKYFPSERFRKPAWDSVRGRLPALGTVCLAARGLLQRTLKLSLTIDGDALRWSSETFPPARTKTWWPASLLEQSSDTKKRLYNLQSHDITVKTQEH